MSVLIALDGVLRAPNGNPIRDGRLLYECLRMAYPVVILADSSTAEADHWLRLNNIAYDNLVCDEADCGDGEPLRRQQVVACRSKGRVDFLVDVSPDHIWWAIGEGVPTLFFGHPQFAAPVSRIDSNRGRKSWQEIEEEIDRRQKVAEAVTREVEESSDVAGV